MRHLKNWLGVLVSLAALAWIFRTFELGEIWDSLRTTDLVWLIPVPVIQFVSFLLRSARWGAVFGDSARPRFWNLFSTMTMGYLFNNLLPARAGELIRVHLLGRRESLSRSTVLATVIIERTGDLVVLLCMIVFVLWHQPLPGWAENAAKAVAVITLAAILGVVSFRRFGFRLVTLLTSKLTFLSGSVLQRMNSITSGFSVGLTSLFQLQWLSRFAVLTMLIWMLELTLVDIVARAFGLEFSVGDLLFIILAIALGMMVPSSPGYIGTYEFFGVSALALLGVSGGVALSFVIVLHGTTYIGTNLIGLVSMALFKPGRVLHVGDGEPDVGPAPKAKR